VPVQRGPYRSLLAAGRGLLCLAAMALGEEHEQPCALISAAHSVLGSVVLLRQLCCVLLDITRLHMKHWRWGRLPTYSGLLASIRPPSRLRQTLL